jgi:response regulator RpfG family c-di-GMP phosphodiesterase
MWIPMVRHHLDHFGGRDFSDRLIGEVIPQMARILAVLDLFDTMTIYNLKREKATN